MTYLSSTSRGTRAKKRTEVERVYHLIKARILDCRLRPGTVLAEVDLAERFKTSRTPVREACNILSQEGWIQHIPYKGYLIPPISLREVVETYEYRKLLETFTAERGCRNASDEEIERLVRIEKLERSNGLDMRKFCQANEDFHLGLAKLAGVRRVYQQLKLVLEYVHRLDVLSTEKDITMVGHQALIRALRKRNPEEAAQAMAAHIDAARDRMLKLFGASSRS